MSRYEFIKHLEEGEECRELKQYPGYYITTRGRVWSARSSRFLTPQKQKTYADKRRGYKPPAHNRYFYSVCIMVGGGKYVAPRIHTLVGRAFLPEYREGLFILHKEETLPYPQINYVENLWVGNNKDNMEDMWRKGRRKYATYSIDGKVYTSQQLEEVGLKHNISLCGVRSRIRNPNYPAWYRC